MSLKILNRNTAEYTAQKTTITAVMTVAKFLPVSDIIN
jgi:hypothetical protein